MSLIRVGVYYGDYVYYTWLCALSKPQSVMSIMLFELDYGDYSFSLQLCALCALSDDYADYIFIFLLYHLWIFNAIIHIIVFSTHYVNYSDKSNYHNTYNWYNSYNFYIPPHSHLKWCLALDSGFNSRNAFLYIQGMYRSKSIAKSRWSVHLPFGRHPQGTGV
jgi:hypothetical protein